MKLGKSEAQNHGEHMTIQAISLSDHLDRVNEVLLDEHALTKDASTVLVGAGAQLDSMGFVNFVVALEELAAQEIGAEHQFGGDALSTKGSVSVPSTLTVASLTDALLALTSDNERKGH